jgi:hypothetical protein
MISSEIDSCQANKQTYADTLVIADAYAPISPALEPSEDSPTAHTYLPRYVLAVTARTTTVEFGGGDIFNHSRQLTPPTYTDVDSWYWKRGVGEAAQTWRGMVRELLKDKQFEEVVGMDVAVRSLEIASEWLAMLFQLTQTNMPRRGPRNGARTHRCIACRRVKRRFRLSL